LLVNELDVAQNYDVNSRTQFIQGKKLLKRVSFLNNDKILDVGCGNGRLTLEMLKANETINVVGLDKSVDMIKLSEELLSKSSCCDRVIFVVANILELHVKEVFDLVFSNSAIHWMIPLETTYKILYNVLKCGGRLAICQSGFGSYFELHNFVFSLIIKMKLSNYFKNWKYPSYYPMSNELVMILESVGFKDVKVESIESDGFEYPTLCDDFLNASFLPYLRCIPSELRHNFKNNFLRGAKELDKFKNIYVHQLLAFANKK
jgi:ubiquinone/menaquinone biosynthesis C-methylase UbiE